MSDGGRSLAIQTAQNPSGGGLAAFRTPATYVMAIRDGRVIPAPLTTINPQQIWASTLASRMLPEKAMSRSFAALPFTVTQVATFNLPWRIAFLPDGRMLITEKVGPLWVVTQQGAKTEVKNVPAVLHHDQGGMLGVYLSPHYKTDHYV